MCKEIQYATRPQKSEISCAVGDVSLHGQFPISILVKLQWFHFLASYGVSVVNGLPGQFSPGWRLRFFVLKFYLHSTSTFRSS